MTAEQIDSAADRELAYIRQAYDGKKAEHMARGVEMLAARLLALHAQITHEAKAVERQA